MDLARAAAQDTSLMCKNTFEWGGIWAVSATFWVVAAMESQKWPVVFKLSLLSVRFQTSVSK